MTFKFSHVADLHLGGWRRESLNELGYEVFKRIVDKSIDEEVDFFIISGDLYDVSNPQVDVVDLATKQLKRLKDNGISVFGIMGSHDFSPSNKSMIRPLVSAEFFVNVSKPEWDEKNEELPLKLNFFEEPNTKIKLAGMRARKRSLEIEDYQQLNRDYLEQEPGQKIFVLHTMLQELRPKEYKEMKAAGKSFLPKGFLYYAGGHIHKTIPEELRTKGKITIKKGDDLERKVIYPGAIFPTNFRELEQDQYGGFCIVSGDENELEVHYTPIEVRDVISVTVDASNKTVQKVKDMINETINTGDFQDKIITVRLEGYLKAGKSFEIKANEIVQKLKENGAYEVLVNKSHLYSQEYESIRVNTSESTEEIEERLVHEHSQKSDIKNISKEQLEEKIYRLLDIIGREEKPGEKKKNYKRNVLESFYNIMDIPKEEDEF
jgi:hypothetical protein